MKSATPHLDKLRAKLAAPRTPVVMIDDDSDLVTVRAETPSLPSELIPEPHAEWTEEMATTRAVMDQLSQDLAALKARATGKAAPRQPRSRAGKPVRVSQLKPGDRVVTLTARLLFVSSCRVGGKVVCYTFASPSYRSKTNRHGILNLSRRQVTELCRWPLGSSPDAALLEQIRQSMPRNAVKPA